MSPLIWPSWSRVSPNAAVKVIQNEGSKCRKNSACNQEKTERRRKNPSFPYFCHHLEWGYKMGWLPEVPKDPANRNTCQILAAICQLLKSLPNS